MGLLNSAETEEYNRAAMVIQRGYKARIAKRKLSGISEKGKKVLKGDFYLIYFDV